MDGVAHAGAGGAAGNLAPSRDRPGGLSPSCVLPAACCNDVFMVIFPLL
jgi:hypothetical protein